MDYELLILDIRGEPILLYGISQINNVSDGSLAELNVFVIARYSCLLVHYHGTTVALELHTAALLERLCDQFQVAKTIHCVLAFQKYDLHEVEFIFEIWRLI